MNELPPRPTLSKGKIFLLIVLLLLSVTMISVLATYLFFGGRHLETSPLPAGMVEIRVDFQGLSTDDYNALNRFLAELAREYTSTGPDAAPAGQEAESFHGFWNNGFAFERYRPNHPVPSPEIEADLQARFRTFLEERDIDGKGETLELRYGP